MIDCILKIVSKPPNKYDFDTELNFYSMMPVIQWLNGVLYGISHSSHVDVFIYTDTITSMSTKYTKKNKAWKDDLCNGSY